MRLTEFAHRLRQEGIRTNNVVRESITNQNSITGINVMGSAFSFDRPTWFKVWNMVLELKIAAWVDFTEDGKQVSIQMDKPQQLSQPELFLLNSYKK